MGVERTEERRVELRAERLQDRRRLCIVLQVLDGESLRAHHGVLQADDPALDEFVFQADEVGEAYSSVERHRDGQHHIDVLAHSPVDTVINNIDVAQGIGIHSNQAAVDAIVGGLVAGSENAPMKAWKKK